MIAKMMMTAFAVSVAVPGVAAAQAAPAADQRPDVTVTPADGTLAIANLAAAVRAQHFSQAEGQRIAVRIERWAKAGRYARITSGRELAAALKADLRAVSGDEHFLVDYFVVARPFPVPTTGEGGGDEAARRTEFALRNYGVMRAERLDGNIGYLRIDRFAPAAQAGPVLRGALAALAATDALIIDLRANGGGFGDTVSLLAGELLPKRTRLNDVISRDGVQENWTEATATGRYADKPVYVLVSGRTFSAAEALAYDLQALGRAKVVGERTRGGANPVTRTLLSSRFWALVPTAKTRNPITGTNWGGVGVKPDIPVAADAALATAQKEAARLLLPQHRDDPLTRELEALAAP